MAVFVGQVDPVGGEFVGAEHAERALAGAGAEHRRDGLRERAVRRCFGDVGAGCDAAARRLERRLLGKIGGQGGQQQGARAAVGGQQAPGPV
ncbi:hypothetical protein [Streptomyces scabiei]|uniref:hypothetical protein n=1 Tax=Streptomyces scabiei TaxID=1930 RepID=UPI0027DFFD02|nr:hypothetical protein [Streptomyces sp. LBUM 1487]